MRPSRLIFAALVGACLLPGCTWLIGYDHVPQPQPPFKVGREHATIKLDGLTLDAAFAGIGERVVTAMSPWGRVARVVNPYGEDTLVFNLAAQNEGDELAVLSASEALLTADDAPPKPSRGLDDFRHRWPTWAVDGQDETADREAALANVLQTLLLDRVLLGGSRGAGRLAFPLLKPSQSLTLTLPVKVGDTSRVASFHWEVF